MSGDLTMRAGRTDDREREYLESLIRADCERCYPGEALADIRHRARFSKADKGLLRDWMEVARRRAVAAKSTADAAGFLVAAE